MGDPALWDRAEADLLSAITTFNLRRQQASGDASAEVDGDMEVEIDAGGGAFYGPKIDVRVTDALQKQHQCATIQLDFQLPLRFDLAYADSDGTQRRPVMIHR